MLNHIAIQGRLTRDPELRYTPNNIPVATFCVAVDRDYDRQKTDFINVVAWRQTAEFVDKYFRKGQLIVVSGSLQLRDWTDKRGDKRTVAEVVAEHVYFCGDKPNTSREPVDVAPGSGFTEYDGEDDGELPF